MKRTILLIQTSLLLLIPGYLGYFNEVLTSGHTESYDVLTDDERSTNLFQLKNTIQEQKLYSDDAIFKKLGEQRYSIKKIVIDPGHGGRDGGCSGTNSSEKKIALKIGLKLGKKIKNTFPYIEVIFTRKTDVFIPLHRRAEIANENEADLFISIHCNYIVNAAKIRGSETYVMGLHKAEHNLEVAKRENEVIYLEDNYSTNYGVDPNSAEGHIILSAYQHAHLEQSILFAEKVEKNVKQTTKHRSRGVKQAGFQVLKNTTMPSVLIETGYLSNSRDQNYLLSSAGQSEMSEVIWNAFSEYKTQIENDQLLNEDFIADNSKLEIEKKPAKIQNMPEEESSHLEPQIATSPSKVEKKKEPVVIRKVIQETGIVNNNSIGNKVKKAEVSVSKKSVDFRIQLAASKKELDLIGSKWNDLGYKVIKIKEDVYFKYQIDSFNSIKEASRVKAIIRQRGFKDAFLVAYYNGNKISLAQAKNF